MVDAGVIHVDAQQVAYRFGVQKPLVEVPSGSVLKLELRDAYDRQFVEHQDVARYLRERSQRRSNPVTGPIGVIGAQPGDGLQIEIFEIALGAQGYAAAVPGIGVLGHTEIVPQLGTFVVRDQALWFQNRVRLPLRPMIGVVGVAPMEGAVPSLQLGYHGGNLDFNDITVGTILNFPVYQPGALFALGDAHAAMGFCEVHSGVNIDADVTVRVNLVCGAGWQRPWFETATEVMTMGVEERLEDAIAVATSQMVALLQGRLAISHTEAILIAGAAVDIRLGQAANFGVKVSAYAAFPKSAFP